MRLGVIGLGNIGGAVAANLLADGHAVAVYDLDPARAAPLAAAGARAADSPAELARESEIALASLPTPEAVEAAAGAWLSGAARGSVLVDLSTNAPDAVRALGARLAAAGFHLLEAPLTGGAPGAKARSLVFLVGGEAEVLARCAPVLARLGRRSFHMGPLGSGNVAKLVNSLLAFTATWVSLEGLALAAAAGLDLRTLVEAVRAGGAGNFFIDRLVEGIGQRGRPPQFALGLAAKDARLVVDTALRLGVPAPVAGQIAQVFAAAARGGLAERDWSDLVEWAERQAGQKLVLRPAEPKPGS
jgi:3-hydroxyisobutyrate dehydrogenase-like beta-hydroxyacid dehydrogenase